MAGDSNNCNRRGQSLAARRNRKSLSRTLQSGPGSSLSGSPEIADGFCPGSSLSPAGRGTVESQVQSH